MPAASSSTTLLPAAGSASPSISRKSSASAPEKKYKCQFCNRAFSRSEHRSRHERSRKLTRPATVAHASMLTFFLQTPKNALSNALSAVAPSFVATSYCATTVPYTQRMEVCRCKATLSDEAMHPSSRLKQPHPSSPWVWSRQPSSR